MDNEIHFGEEHTCLQTRVYDNSDMTIGMIKRQENKPKYIWNPLGKYKEKYPFAVLDTDLTTSKQLVHRMLCGI